MVHSYAMMFSTFDLFRKFSSKICPNFICCCLAYSAKDANAWKKIQFAFDRFKAWSNTTVILNENRLSNITFLVSIINTYFLISGFVKLSNSI